MAASAKRGSGSRWRRAGWLWLGGPLAARLACSPHAWVLPHCPPRARRRKPHARGVGNRLACWASLWPSLSSPPRNPRGRGRSQTLRAPRAGWGGLAGPPSSWWGPGVGAQRSGSGALPDPSPLGVITSTLNHCHLRHLSVALGNRVGRDPQPPAAEGASEGARPRGWAVAELRRAGLAGRRAARRCAGPGSGSGHSPSPRGMLPAGERRLLRSPPGREPGNLKTPCSSRWAALSQLERALRKMSL